MFDGFKIQRLFVSHEKLLRSDFPSFNFLNSLRLANGFDKTHLLTRYKSLYYSLKRKFDCTNDDNPGIINKLAGSFHKFSNNGDHNANDLDVRKLLTVVDTFVTKFGIDPFNSNLTKLEFGVNVNLPYSVEKFLNSVGNHKNKPFARNSGNKLVYLECEMSQYTVKLYDKGDQIRRKNKTNINLDDVNTNNLLRVEVKVKSMGFLRQRGINMYNLVDLLNRELYPVLGELLLAIFQEIHFDNEDIDKVCTSPKDLETLIKARYIINSSALFGHQPMDARYRTQLSRAKKRFRLIALKYPNITDYRAEVGKLIADNWNKITYVDGITLRKVRGTLKRWRAIDYSHHKYYILWQDLKNIVGRTVKSVVTRNEALDNRFKM